MQVDGALVARDCSGSARRSRTMDEDEAQNMDEARERARNTAAKEVRAAVAVYCATPALLRSTTEAAQALADTLSLHLHPRICAFTKNREVAWEVLNDFWAQKVDSAKICKAFQDGKPLLHWCSAVAKNLWLSQFVRGKRNQALAPLIEALPAEPVEADVDFLEIERVRAAFLTLNEQDRNLLSWFEIFDLAYNHHQEGVAPATLRQRAQAARSRLRNAFEGSVGVHASYEDFSNDLLRADLALLIQPINGAGQQHEPLDAWINRALKNRVGIAPEHQELVDAWLVFRDGGGIENYVDAYLALDARKEEL